MGTRTNLWHASNQPVLSNKLSVFHILFLSPLKLQHDGSVDRVVGRNVLFPWPHCLQMCRMKGEGMEYHMSGNNAYQGRQRAGRIPQNSLL